MASTTKHADRIDIYILSILFGIIGIVLLIACLAYLFNVPGESLYTISMRLSGNFLLESFHIAAFFVPFFFAFAIYRMMRYPHQPIALFTLLLLIFPFVTFSLSLRLIFGSAIEHTPFIQGVISAFTLRGGIVASLLLTAGLIIGCSYALKWSTSYSPRKRKYDRAIPQDQSIPEVEQFVGNHSATEQAASGHPAMGQVAGGHPAAVGHSATEQAVGGHFAMAQSCRRSSRGRASRRRLFRGRAGGRRSFCDGAGGKRPSCDGASCRRSSRGRAGGRSFCDRASRRRPSGHSAAEQAVGGYSAAEQAVGDRSAMAQAASGHPAMGQGFRAGGRSFRGRAGGRRPFCDGADCGRSFRGRASGRRLFRGRASGRRQSNRSAIRWRRAASGRRSFRDGAGGKVPQSKP